MHRQQFIELFFVFATLTVIIALMAVIPWPDAAQTDEQPEIVSLDTLSVSPFKIPLNSFMLDWDQTPTSTHIVAADLKDAGGALKREAPARNPEQIYEIAEQDPNAFIQMLKSEMRGSYPQCHTPRSLMLHNHFGLKRMQELAEAIEEHNLQTMTYREAWEMMQNGECPPENAIVVSLDDLSTAWVDPLLKEMIHTFTERDLKLVVGVVLRTPYTPGVWEYLQSLDNSGVEIASHTIDHLNLPTCTDAQLHHQISDSYELICDHLGQCPISLIVPFGSMDTTGRIMEYSHQYVFVVGIANGLEIAAHKPYYVGRISPSTTSLEATFQVLDIVYHR